VFVENADHISQIKFVGMFPPDVFDFFLRAQITHLFQNNGFNQRARMSNPIRYQLGVELICPI
jgi:hypothetical protein